MGVVITVLKTYFIITIGLMLLYGTRHLIFTYNRLYGRQRISYRDVYDSDLPRISVLIPMHNEELVLRNVLEALLRCDYDQDKMEIIPIDDHSSDATGRMLDEYYRRYPFIMPLHRDESLERGKPPGLNDAMKIATGDIIIVFDADYRPSRNLLKKLAMAFHDPEVGAVMGRVIPVNANTNLLTGLLNLERSGGYQVDQQARYNLGLVPQYGGTVGGFRKDIILSQGGFDTKVLAEDTELTYRIYTQGWTVAYDNSAECYEESPENWRVRGRQIRRWARGHNEVMFRHLFRVIFTDNLTFLERLDGLLLLMVYAMPFLLGLANLDCIALFFLGEMNIFSGWFVLLFVGIYNSWGNFAPFYEIAAGAMLDGMRKEILMLPLLCFCFYFYMFQISLGFMDAVVDAVSRRSVVWAKTERFAKATPVPEDASAPAAAGAAPGGGGGK